MSSLCLITDQWPGEPDILTGHRDKALVIRGLIDKREIIRILPTTPWTHQSLVEVAEQLDQMLGEVFDQEGADAYLEDNFIGSTEI